MGFISKTNYWQNISLMKRRETKRRIDISVFCLPQSFLPALKCFTKFKHLLDKLKRSWSSDCEICGNGRPWNIIGTWDNRSHVHCFHVNKMHRYCAQAAMKSWKMCTCVAWMQVHANTGIKGRWFSSRTRVWSWTSSAIRELFRETDKNMHRFVAC